VRGYIQEVKSAVPNAVIILQDMKKGTNERIHNRFKEKNSNSHER
jgi:hypothetical protein